MEGYKQALTRYIDATNTHDFANVADVLHPNAIYWFSDKTCTTINEIGSYFENTWRIIQDEVYTAVDVQWISVDQHSATCLYTYQYEGYCKGEFGQSHECLYENGDWRMEADS